MGSFDIVSRNLFKTGPDGRQVFFPLGIIGRGYTLGSAEDYRRLRRQVNAFILVELAAIIILSIVRHSVAAAALAYYWPTAFVGLLLFFVVLYFLWMRSWQGRLQSSDERLSLRDLVGLRRPTTRVPEPPAERVLRLVVVSGMVLAMIVAAILIATKRTPAPAPTTPFWATAQTPQVEVGWGAMV